jgi:hypothetical protein
VNAARVQEFTAAGDVACISDAVEVLTVLEALDRPA